MINNNFNRVGVFPNKIYPGWISIWVKNDDKLAGREYQRPADLSDEQLAIELAKCMSHISPKHMYSTDLLEGNELLEAFMASRYQLEMNRRYENLMDDPGYCEAVFGEYSNEALNACGRFFPAAEY